MVLLCARAAVLLLIHLLVLMAKQRATCTKEARARQMHVTAVI
jgi:hypothetical protein